MFCNKCGLQNPDEAVSCTQCGNPLTTLFPTQTAPASAAAGSTATASAPAVWPPVTAVEPQAGVMPVAAQQTDGKATASLILGILSLTCFGFFAGIPAVICGHLSRSAIRKSMGRLKGEGMALAGLIMGYISIACIPVILIIAAVAIPNLLKARTMANEASAVASVRTVTTASISYRADKGSYPVSLRQLRDANLIVDPMLANGIKSGYRFTLQGTGERFLVEAVPVRAGNTGIRNFCSTEDGVIRSTTGLEECTADSPSLR